MIAAEPDRVQVTVSDDGRGGAAPDLAGGSGLAGLTDRVAAVGGTLTVASPPGEGTRLIAELPLASAVGEPPAPGGVTGPVGG
jgi:signal transduction histidine kinase